MLAYLHLVSIFTKLNVIGVAIITKGFEGARTYHSYLRENGGIHFCGIRKSISSTYLRDQVHLRGEGFIKFDNISKIGSLQSSCVHGLFFCRDHRAIELEIFTLPLSPLLIALLITSSKRNERCN